MAKALTALAVEKVKPGPARREIPDGLLRGLYLVVQATGAKSWAVRYRHRGAPRKLTIGAWPAIDLAAARDIGAKALRNVAEGCDPAADKRNGNRTTTADKIDNVIADFIERHVKRQRTNRETERILRREVEPRWHGRRIQEITRRDVISLVDGIEQRAPIMANRTFGVLRVLFRWATDKAIIESSPCAGIRAPGIERQRDRVLDDDELRLVWNACDLIGWPYGPQVKLLILTGARRGEVAGMRWSEIDFAARIWRMPRHRVKNDRAHEVPLSEMANTVLEQLRQQRGKSDLLFLSETGSTAVSSFVRAKRRLDSAILESLRATATNPDQVEPPPRWVIHDIRRTVASGMARLGINLPVIEKVLNHQGGSFGGIVGIYQRHSFSDEKRKALEAWARFVTGLVENRATPIVLSLRAACL
jgi:integrase